MRKPQISVAVSSFKVEWQRLAMGAGQKHGMIIFVNMCVYHAFGSVCIVCVYVNYCAKCTEHTYTNFVTCFAETFNGVTA